MASNGFKNAIKHAFYYIAPQLAVAAATTYYVYWLTNDVCIHLPNARKMPIPTDQTVCNTLSGKEQLACMDGSQNASLVVNLIDHDHTPAFGDIMHLCAGTAAALTTYCLNGLLSQISLRQGAICMDQAHHDLHDAHMQEAILPSTAVIAFMLVCYFELCRWCYNRRSPADTYASIQEPPSQSKRCSMSLGMWLLNAVAIIPAIFATAIALIHRMTYQHPAITEPEHWPTATQTVCRHQIDEDPELIARCFQLFFQIAIATLNTYASDGLTPFAPMEHDKTHGRCYGESFARGRIAYHEKASHGGTWKIFLYVLLFSGAANGIAIFFHWAITHPLKNWCCGNLTALSVFSGGKVSKSQTENLLETSDNNIAMVEITDLDNPTTTPN